MCPICAGEGIAPKVMETKTLKGRNQPCVQPKFGHSLQGAVVMSEAQGRKTRSSKRLSVASYSGKQGWTHFFCIAFKDGSSDFF